MESFFGDRPREVISPRAGIDGVIKEYDELIRVHNLEVLLSASKLQEEYWKSQWKTTYEELFQLQKSLRELV